MVLTLGSGDSTSQGSEQPVRPCLPVPGLPPEAHVNTLKTDLGHCTPLSVPLLSVATLNNLPLLSPSLVS